MRYLKKFNENSVSNILDKLRNEAEEHLAYLLDDVDWEVDVYECGYDTQHQYYKISINYIKEDKYGDGMFFSLKKAKDKIIPYLDFMIGEYNVADEFLIYYLNKSDEMKNFTREQLEKKDIKINYIQFGVAVKE